MFLARSEPPISLASFSIRTGRARGQVVGGDLDGGVVVEDHAVGAERVPVEVPGLLVEADEEVDVLAVAVDPLVAHADLVHARAALDLGGVGAEGLGPVPPPGRGLGEDVARGDDPLAGLPGKPDHHARAKVPLSLAKGPQASRSRDPPPTDHAAAVSLLGAADPMLPIRPERGARLGPMGTTPARGPSRRPRLRARADLLWYLRHADALARWPVLGGEWAHRSSNMARPDESGARRPGPQGSPGPARRTSSPAPWRPSSRPGAARLR